MASWIRMVEGRAAVTQVSPANGTSFTADELHRLVGGYFEVVALRDGSEIMWLNEDGKRLGLPYNPIADLIAHEQGGIAAWDSVVGDVVITTREEGGEGEEEE